MRTNWVGPATLSGCVLVVCAAAAHGAAMPKAGEEDSSCVAEENASPPEAPFPAGTAVERVYTHADPSQSYAVYLPSDYSTAAKWPVLVAMDPRGRALVPLELFRPAAERLGYILISSYDTESDSTWDPNEKALRAMLQDLPRLFSFDERRVYLAGFSGTAMGAWSFANRLQPYIEGLIGFGGAAHDWVELPEGDGYVYFGAAGTTDFNHDRVLELDRTLDSRGVPHRIVFFEGGHQWGPTSLCTQALEWMELQAIQRGRRPRSDEFIDVTFERQLEDARRFERTGEFYEAWVAYRAIAEDYEGLRDVGDLAGRAAVLRKTPSVRDEIKHRDRLERTQRDFVNRLNVFLGSFRENEWNPRLKRELQRLRLDELRQQSIEAADVLDRQAARRQLEIFLVYASFYGPREFREKGDEERASRMLELAARVLPDGTKNRGGTTEPQSDTD